MRVVFIGCVEFSAALLDSVLNHPEVELVGLVTRTHSRHNADFQDLRAQVQSIGCPVFTDNDPNLLADWLRERRPELVLCCGWSQLLSTEILAIPPLGVVGYHPAALPHNRGRHPIIWALALGLRHTASTFFLMDAGADSGDILSQEPVSIETQDHAGDLYLKLIKTAQQQLRSLISSLADGTAQRIPQDHSAANYWRKRGVADGCIDWRMSAQTIHNLVRALAPPYPGAHCEFNGQAIKIWRSRPVSNYRDNIEAGKILSVYDGCITVKCGVGAIELVDHEFSPLPQEGSYL